MRRTGDTLVTIQVRCSGGCEPKVLREAFATWLRECECEVTYLAIKPAPPPERDP